MSCTSETSPDVGNCSMINSAASAPVLSLGGAIEIKEPSGKATRCTALMSFSGIGEKTMVEITTARHCIQPTEASELFLKPYDGTGYLHIPATSDYISKIGVAYDIIQDTGLGTSKNGLISNKRSTQIFSLYTNNTMPNTSIKTLSKQLKQETVALGSPLCSTVEDKEDQMKKGNSLKACFLYSDLVKFSSVALIDGRTKLALYRSKVLGADLKLNKSTKPSLQEWNAHLTDQTSEEINSIANSIQYAASVCENKIEAPSSLSFPNSFCAQTAAVRKKLRDAKIITEDKVDISDILNEDIFISFIHTKFENMLQKWTKIRDDIYNSEFVLMGNNITKKTNNLSFGSSYLHKVPSTLPSVHRNYGVVSHFDRSKVLIEKGASGSMLVVDGTVIALLSSVDGVDTSGGLTHALPTAVDVEIPATVSTTSPVTGLGGNIETIVNSPEINKTGTIVKETDITESFTQVAADCT
jgi:hypothetical protein